ncbi:MAG TPA: hypothetical protein VIR61_01435, partial [Sulfuricaulis sp.]
MPIIIRARPLSVVLDSYASQAAHLNLLELSPRHCGVRSALWHAILHKNFGCFHFIIEHDYDDQGEGATGDPLYGQYHGLDSVMWHAQEIGIEVA